MNRHALMDQRGPVGPAASTTSARAAIQRLVVDEKRPRLRDWDLYGSGMVGRLKGYRRVATR
jgi:hypothetical protein